MDHNYGARRAVDEYKYYIEDDGADLAAALPSDTEKDRCYGRDNYKVKEEVAVDERNI